MKANRVLGVGVIVALLLMSFFSATSFAQDTGTEEAVAALDKAKEDNKSLPNGWHIRFKPNATISFSDSRTVVGQPDGMTFTFGLSFNLEALLKKDKHEWRNTLMLSEAISRTPAIDEFIISTDKLQFESMYMYYFKEWVGLYGRLALDSKIFPGHDYQTDKKDYVITYLDGSSETLFSKDRVKLTDYFSPTTLKEGFGPFFRPVASKEVNLEILIGFAAWQTFDEGDLSITDDDATAEIELTELENSYQLGGENIWKLWGDVWEDKLTYQVRAELMMPFWMDPDSTTVEGIDRLNVKLGAGLDVRFTEWLALSYLFSAIREPQVVNDWQIQNTLLLTLTYSLYKYIEY